MATFSDGHSSSAEIPHSTQAHTGAPRLRYDSPIALEWVMPGRDTGGFVDSQSKNAAGWWSGWSGAERDTNQQIFEIRPARPPHLASPCDSTASKDHRRLDRPRHRGEMFQIMSPVKRPARFGVPHVSGGRWRSRCCSSSQSRALAYTAERTAPIRPLGEAPWGACCKTKLTVHCAAPLNFPKVPEGLAKLLIVTSGSEGEFFNIIDPCWH